MAGSALTQAATYAVERRRERRSDRDDWRRTLDALQERVMTRVDESRAELGRRIDDVGAQVGTVAERVAGIEGVTHALLGFHDPTSRNRGQ